MSDPVIEVTDEDMSNFEAELQRRLSLAKFDEPEPIVVETVEPLAEPDEPIDALPQNESLTTDPGFVVDHTLDDSETPALLDEIEIKSFPSFGKTNRL